MLRVLFMGGLGRSGSTLIERLLGELPGVHPVGEVVHLWERGLGAGERCGCGESFHDCRFWRSVGDVAFGGWDRVDLPRVLTLKAAIDRTRFLPLLAAPRLPLSFRRRLEEYLQYYLRLYAAVREVTGAEVIVDSSKHASLAYCLRWASELDLRVLHVVRDSRAVAHSWTKQVRRPEADDSFMATYSPRRAAVQWNAQNLAFDVLGRLGTSTQLVRYEDFAEAPEDELRRLARFAGIGLGGGPPVAAGRADLSVAHTVSGNPMRFAAGAVVVRRDDSWHTQLARRHRALVSTLTFPLRARYGYIRAEARNDSS